MIKSNSEISDVLIIEPDVFSDSRGDFREIYDDEKYAMIGIPKIGKFNESYSHKGVIRGLHYQVEPFAQGKLVRVVFGKVQDIAVDLRKSSKTFLKYVSTELSRENKRQLWIPPGFAHGFLVQSDGAVFQYGCSNRYSKEHERGILWNDPQLGIKWDEKTSYMFGLSDKDKTWPLVKDATDFFK